jgi:hypothetical protein
LRKQRKKLPLPTGRRWSSLSLSRSLRDELSSEQEKTDRMSKPRFWFFFFFFLLLSSSSSSSSSFFSSSFVQKKCGRQETEI